MMKRLAIMGFGLFVSATSLASDRTMECLQKLDSFCGERCETIDRWQGINAMAYSNIRSQYVKLRVTMQDYLGPSNLSPTGKNDIALMHLNKDLNKRATRNSLNALFVDDLKVEQYLKLAERDLNHRREARDVTANVIDQKAQVVADLTKKLFKVRHDLDTLADKYRDKADFVYRTLDVSGIFTRMVQNVKGVRTCSTYISEVFSDGNIEEARAQVTQEFYKDLDLQSAERGLSTYLQQHPLREPN